MNYDDGSIAYFEKAAQKSADAFWFFLLITALIVYFYKWFALIPLLLAVWCAASSISCTSKANELREFKTDSTFLTESQRRESEEMREAVVRQPKSSQEEAYAQYHRLMKRKYKGSEEKSDIKDDDRG